MSQLETFVGVVDPTMFWSQDGGKKGRGKPGRTQSGKKYGAIAASLATSPQGMLGTNEQRSRRLRSQRHRMPRLQLQQEAKDKQRRRRRATCHFLEMFDLTQDDSPGVFEEAEDDDEDTRLLTV